MSKRFLALGSILLVALLLACCASIVLFMALFFVYQGTANAYPRRMGNGLPLQKRGH